MLKRNFQQAGDLVGHGRRTRQGEHRIVVDAKHLVRPVVNHHIAHGGPAITGDEYAILVTQCQNGRALGGFNGILAPRCRHGRGHFGQLPLLLEQIEKIAAIHIL